MRNDWSIFYEEQVQGLIAENARLKKLLKLIFSSTVPYRDNGECVFIESVTEEYNKIMGEYDGND